ncbi:MAG: hypothetical protein ACKVPJ_09065 [Chitinophagales bacterium]
MEESIAILKNRTLPASQDYASLRKKGLEYIESLASDLWTDYNSHDPGITILEALCYAITELGYKTGFDIKDLMADENGKIAENQTFFSAKNIFGNTALTIEDYRKLLADVTGVRNAWLLPYRDEDGYKVGEPMQEIPIYADCKKDALVYKKTEHFIQLHGLYQVVIDLLEHDAFGDMNNGNIIYQFQTQKLFNTSLEFLFPKWNAIDYDLLASLDPSSVSDVKVKLKDQKWKITCKLGTGAQKISFDFFVLPLMVKNFEDSAGTITSELKKKENLTEVFSLYVEKIKLTVSILKTVKVLLHQHRNLCEDFVRIDTVKTQELAFCADIQVKPDADVEEVYANILFQIENYLNPEVKFYSLKELVNAGVPKDEIFEGPVLQHGFIKTDEIKATQLRSEIHVSDIINFIMETGGVISVKDVLLTTYNSEGDAMLPSERWCLKIEPGYKPVLNYFKSKVIFLKGKLPFRPKLDETFDTLKYLHGKEQQNKRRGTTDDLNIPNGSYRNLQDYVSVQHEFPNTYGLGNAGLSTKTTAERRAHAKQMKAYLMFYDQLLVNFFKQMHHAKDLFSLDETVLRTYYFNYISELKGTDEEDGANEMYMNAIGLQQFASTVPASGDLLRKTYDALVENQETFYDRRHRFLDHLLARFAESFNDYALLMYEYKELDNGGSTEYVSEKIADATVIANKINFLKDYPVISRERGKAFNYLDTAALWDTENVSGFEKRIARLAGIKSFLRRFLFCYKQIEIQKTIESPAKYFFTMKDEEGNILLQSLQEYKKFSELEGIIDKISGAAASIEQYKLLDISASEFSYELIDEEGNSIAKSGVIYTSADDRDAAVSHSVELTSNPCSGEGMHLLEHILLRPRFAATKKNAEEDYKLMEVCLNEDCKFCGEEDPYSFRISLILPGWEDRFRNIQFRQYFEDMARTEVPAHCLLKLCWISNTVMQEFDVAYKNWIEALNKYETDLAQKEENKNDLRDASNAMITVMKKLHSVYPEATLHNCEEGEANPVILGNTVLGTFKK